MSRLQSALRALPPQSLVTPAMLASQKEVNAELDKVRVAEVAVAKRAGGAWRTAISLASQAIPS